MVMAASEGYSIPGCLEIVQIGQDSFVYLYPTAEYYIENHAERDRRDIPATD